MRGIGVLMMFAVIWLSGAAYQMTADAAAPRWFLASIWHGFHAADLLMALFLFCCGASVAASAERVSQPSAASAAKYAVRRSIVLIVGGLIVVNAVSFTLRGSAITLTGPLQQIAVATFVTAMATASLPPKALVVAVVYLLANYGFLLAVFDAETHSTAATDPLAAYGFQSSLVAWVDAGYLPGEKNFGNWDQFGILPTFIGTLVAICGAVFQRLVLAVDRGQRRRRLMAAVLIGSVLVMASWGASGLIPINHYLWTPTFFGAATGALIVLTSAFQLAFDSGRSADLSVLRSLGRNSLLFFLICAFANEVPLTAWNVGLAKRILPGHPSAALLFIVVAQLGAITAFGYWLAAKQQYLTINRCPGMRTAGDGLDTTNPTIESNAPQLIDHPDGA